MGVPLLPIWLLLTGLLGRTGEGTCLSIYKDTLELATRDTDLLVSQREWATSILGGQRPPPEVKYAQKITWKHPNTDKSKGKASDVRTGGEIQFPVRIKSENWKQLEGKVFLHLEKLTHYPLGQGFAEGTGEKYSEHMMRLRSDVMELTPGMDETTSTPDLLYGLHQENHGSKAGSEEKLSKIFENFHDIYDLLRSGIITSKKIRGFNGEKTLYQLMFCLGDTLTQYLSILETHSLVNMKALEESLNKGDNWMVLFHYVLGKFLPENNTASVFLTYDFKTSLQENGISQEIHLLLNIMSEENWKKMENLYLVMQIELKNPRIKSYTGSKHLRETTMWAGIKPIILATADGKVNPSLKDTHHDIVKSAVKELANEITDITKYPTYPRDDVHVINWQLTQQKLKLNLIFHFIQFLVDHDESFYPQLQGIDKSFKLLHDVVKVGKDKLDELSKIIHPDHQSINPSGPNHVYNTRYLARKNNGEERKVVETQTNQSKERQYINLLEAPTPKSPAEIDKLDTYFDRNQEIKIVTASGNPNSKTSWIESISNQPVANKLDRLTFKNLIDHPYEGIDTEKILQLLNGVLGPEFQIASPLIEQIQAIVRKYDLIKDSPKSLLEKKTDLARILANPVGLRWIEFLN
ncbi:hypothetical protein MJO28_004510 [Puccinia striiformis f. sp. tritici]|uniref:Uncharacterized protein n=1 Tax=Puccinia striiformis f. sp. tritici TaxID=168172 RepID=A0ACC0EQQ0_9BASI|nr:hypothetical protein MJO28_004510 [Puccinia striiformis f. sp. tritici]